MGAFRKTNIRRLISILPILFFLCGPLCGREREHRKFRVVIDAGHGGRDPGALGAVSKEKDINLAIALKLGKLIENNTDAELVYTRKTDVFIPLDERAEIANRSNANLFISIHTNALRNKSYQGVETYTLGLARSEENLEVAKRENSVILLEDDYHQRYEGFDPSSSESYIIFEMMQDRYLKQSIDLATVIQKNACNLCGRIDRGVKQAGFLVLRNTGMPSVLVEVGYISNRVEERYLNTESGQKAIATAIYNGFVKCKNEYEKAAHSGVVAQEIGLDEQIMVKETQNKEPLFVDGESDPSDFDSEPITDQPVANDNRKVYKIQIAASVTPLPQNSSVFKGLKGVECYEEKGWYKYTYGAANSLSEIKQVKRNVVDKKIKDAFIVVFRNGKKIE